MSAFIESSVMDIGDGDKFLSIRRVIPDLTFMDLLQEVLQMLHLQ